MRVSSRRVAWVLAALAGVAVFVVSTQVFPYGSTNHDEAVYLQQAAMLLEGRLFLRPPVDGSFRPWFFVDAGGRLYPKYAPVPAAMFAAGRLAGSYSFALAATGAAVVGLAYGTVAEAFDRRTGLLAAAFVAASPLFLVDTSLFLPYAPTAAWTLLFAFAYFRADRTEGRRWAAVAGLAIGVAFFSRPYTAVLFAAPFVLHAAWVSRGLDRDVLVRNGVTAGLGLVGVLVALGYNAVVTGSPFLFPYAAFAPRDGLGFGRRAIAGYERTYTPSLALRANAALLRAFAAEWFAAGFLGSGLAVVGLGAFLRRLRPGIETRPAIDARPALLAGVGLSVLVGNLYFWGTLNVLGNLEAPNDGLVHFLGPYYHYDLLVPTAAFAAHGSILLAGRWRRFARRRFGGEGSEGRGRGVTIDSRGRRVTLAGLVAGALVVSTAAVAVAVPPVQESRDVTAQLEAAYEPFEGRDLEGALVFLPTPYGDWLNHPFQALRNDPGYDGEVVYAVRENQFAVVDAFPDRSVYRYTYRGFWAPFAGTPVEARLQPVRQVEDERVVLDSRVGLPGGVESASIRLSADDGAAYYAVDDPSTDLAFDLVVADGTAHLAGNVTPQGDRSIPLDERDEVVVSLLVEYGGGSAFTYRIELPVERRGDGVRALTPYLEVCTVPAQCGWEAAYVPEESPEGVFVETRFESGTAVEPKATVKSDTPVESEAGP